jgi:hypothetical protein
MSLTTLYIKKIRARGGARIAGTPLGEEGCAAKDGAADSHMAAWWPHLINKHRLGFAVGFSNSVFDIFGADGID